MDIFHCRATLYMGKDTLITASHHTVTKGHLKSSPPTCVNARCVHFLMCVASVTGSAKEQCWYCNAEETQITQYYM